MLPILLSDQSLFKLRRNAVSVNMFELEEVQIVETSDEYLEGDGGSNVNSNFYPCGQPPTPAVTTSLLK